MAGQGELTTALAPVSVISPRQSTLSTLVWVVGVIAGLAAALASLPAVAVLVLLGLCTLALVRQGMGWAIGLMCGFALVLVLAGTVSQLTYFANGFGLDLLVRHGLGYVICCVAIAPLLFSRSRHALPRICDEVIACGMALLVAGAFIVATDRSSNRHGWLFLDWDNTSHLALIRRIAIDGGLNYFDQSAGYPRGLHAFIGVFAPALTGFSSVSNAVAMLEIVTWTVTAVLLVVSSIVAFRVTATALPTNRSGPLLAGWLTPVLLMFAVPHVASVSFVLDYLVLRGFLPTTACIAFLLLTLALALRPQRPSQVIMESPGVRVFALSVVVAATAHAYQVLVPVVVVVLLVVVFGQVRQKGGLRRWARCHPRAVVASCVAVTTGIPPMIAVVTVAGFAHASIPGGTPTVDLRLLAGAVTCAAACAVVMSFRDRRAALTLVAVIGLIALATIGLYLANSTWDRHSIGVNYYPRKLEMMLLVCCVPLAAALVSMLWRPLRGGRSQYAILLLPLFLLWWLGGLGLYHSFADGGVGLDSRIVATAEEQSMDTGRPFKVIHPSNFNELLGTLLVNRSSSDGEYADLWSIVGADTKPACQLVPAGTTVWDFRSGAQVVTQC
jgi:hypothetical protein